MATTVRQQAPIDYFSIPKRQSAYNISPSSFSWDETSDTSLFSSNSCDSLESSTGTNGSQPRTTAEYSLPASANQDVKPDVNTLSASNSFEDWMHWDDPESQALSPLIEPLSSTLKFEAVTPEMATIEPVSRGVDPSSIRLNDDTMEFEDSMNNDSLFQPSYSQDMTTADSRDLPPREGLYSTPLSWDRPEPGRRPSPTDMSPTTSYNPLSPTDASTLFSIAMPQPSHSQHYSATTSPSTSPEPHLQNSHKREHSDDEDESTSPPPTRRHGPKKTAHNMIEKRYRTNLNDKITALRDAVPSLRLAAEAASSKSKNKSASISSGSTQSPITSNQDYNEGPHPKLNKATVLSKATEYIAHLEKRSKSLTKENQHLKARIDAFETLLMGQTNVGRPIYAVGQRPDMVNRGWESNMQQNNVRSLPPLQTGNGIVGSRSGRR